MDLDRGDHWEDSQGPPPGAAIPGSSSSIHPNGGPPPGPQGGQMAFPGQDQSPAQIQQRQQSNGASQPQVRNR